MALSADRDIHPAVTSAVAAIDAVHGLPHRKPLEIVSDSRMGVGAAYRCNQETGLPIDIRLNPKGDHLELAALLEIAHWLDHQALGRPGGFASADAPIMAS